MYNQSLYESGAIQAIGMPCCRPAAYPQAADYCAQARNALTPFDPKWASASCADLWQHVCKDDCSIFVGVSETRQGLCGTMQCPAPGSNPYGGGGSGGAVLLILGLAVAAGAGILLAQSSKKK